MEVDEGGAADAEPGTSPEPSPEDDVDFAAPRGGKRRKTQTPGRGDGTPAAKKAKGRSRRAAAKPGLSLFEVAKSHGKAARAAVKEWAAKLKDENSLAEAAADLVTLLVKAGGSDVEADPADPDPRAAIQAATTDVLDNGGEDHFRGRAGAAFHDALLSTVAACVEQLHQRGHLAGDADGVDVAGTFLSAVVTMSGSRLRAFRQVGTEVAGRVVLAVSEVRAGAADARSLAARQAAAEKKKKAAGAAGKERLAATQRALEESTQRCAALDKTVSRLVEGVFANRMSDIDPEVRRSVVRAVGEWMGAFPADFLNDRYLKYVANALCDPDAAVRLGGLSALSALYGSPDHVSALQDFAARFGARLVEMWNDVDDAVAAAALRLAAHMVAANHLESGGVSGVYRLLSDDSEDVRVGAAKLVCETLEAQGRDAVSAWAARPATAAQRGAPGKRRRAAAGAAVAAPDPDELPADSLRLEGLLAVLSKLADGAEGGSEDESGALDSKAVGRVVSALQGEVPVLTDWDVLVDALLDEGLCAHRGAGATATLAAVVLHAVSRACVGRAHGEGAGGAEGAKGFAKKKVRDEMARQQQGVSNALVGNLHRLLQRYEGDQAACASLVPLLGYVQLDAFQLRDRAAEFASVVERITAVFLKHGRADVQAACTAALSHCCATGTASQREAALAAARELLERTDRGLSDCLRRFKELHRDSPPGRDAASADDDRVASDLAGALSRLHHLLAFGEVLNAARRPSLHASALALLRDIAAGAPLREDVAKVAVTTSLAIVNSAALALSRASDVAAAPDLQPLAEGYRSVVEQVGEIAGQADLADEVRATAARAICDALLVLRCAAFQGTVLADAGADLCARLAPSLWGVFEECVMSVDTAEAEQAEEESDDDSGAARGDAAKTRAAAVLAKVTAIAALCRLARAYESQLGAGWMVPSIVSHYVTHGPEVEAIVRAIIGEQEVAALPDHFAAALKIAAIRAAQFEWNEDGTEALDALADRLARVLAGHRVPPDSALRICEVCVRHVVAVLDGRDKDLGALKLLTAGLGHFTGKLAPDAAAHLHDRVDQQLLRFRPDEQAEEWRPYFEFLEALKARGNGGSAAKRARVRSSSKARRVRADDSDADDGEGSPPTPVRAVRTKRAAPAREGGAGRRGGSERYEKDNVEDPDSLVASEATEGGGEGTEEDAEEVDSEEGGADSAPGPDDDSEVEPPARRGRARARR
ncbi:unnamed protein product [Pedinophyceae sp. YPF-701]|nr:unnamed protein product [Pedinophyceae sp. YPF-701]